MRIPEINVYEKFTIKTKDGLEIKVRIQDVPLGKEEDVVNFMFKSYMKEETWNISYKINEDPEALEELRSSYIMLISDNPALICVEDNEDSFNIIGVNILIIHRKGETLPDKFQMKTEKLKKFFELIDLMQQKCPIFDNYNVDSYISGAGLSVDPAYRGCGIAVELLKARIPLCKRLRIPATGVWLTGPGSQKAATKAGYQRLLSYSYEDLSKETGVDFLNTCPFATFDALKIHL